MTELPPFKTRPLMGYTLLDEPLPPLLAGRAPIVVDTLNPHSWVVARSDAPFRQALQRAEILIADGVGMVWASSVLQGRPVQRVTGGDLFAALMRELQRRGGRCFFLGSTPHVLGRIRERLRADYPAVAVGTHSPPFTPEFDESQLAAMVAEVEAFAPDVLFLGLTAPRQEKLAERLRGRVQARVTASIGAVFDFVAGTQPRAPAPMRRLGLEWAYRLLREPRRMWRRNFVSTPLFLAAVLAARLGRAGAQAEPPNRSSKETPHDTR